MQVRREKKSKKNNPYLDTTPPVITAADVVVEAVDANGSTASFTVTATDAVTPAATLNSGVVCTNADGYSSGDLFPLGTFTFTCAVLDEAGNEATQSFDVIVQGRFYNYEALHFFSVVNLIDSCVS